ncbi:MAG: DUF3105 domain-containing protein [Planctomycetaceae bacterium]|nr:DUF3105 domain-containing protein [Planctomycetaceae bacterium]
MRRRRKNQTRRTFRSLRMESLESRAMLHGGSIAGFVFFDADGDGTRDASEGGVPGIVVRLSGSGATDSAIDQSTITDDNGAYSFDELEPGTYQIAKRQSAATIDGQESTTAPGAVSTNNSLANIVLGDEEEMVENNFGERGLRSEFISIAWFFASSPPAQEMLRETIALSEEQGGDSLLAASIRAGRTDVPTGTNGSPAATNDNFSVNENEVLTTAAVSGVLANDTDPEGDALTASLISQPSNGSVTFNNDGSFVYTPNADFFGSDSFTYRASDGLATSNVATVNVNVVSDGVTSNQPFAPVIPGSIEDPGLLGIRMDTQPGAAPFTLDHTATAVDYTGFGNPPSYGPHHAVFRDSQGNSITPRPTGFYDTEQPDEDLVHNLEHGHVWISYNPSLISNEDHLALEQLVRDGGTDTGVILTPRSRNTSPIVLTSLTRQLTLDTFDATTVRNFVNTNRGHSPEGFIPSGQRTDTSETLDDGLPHTETVNAAPVAVDDGYSVNQSDVLTVASTSGVLANDTDADNDTLTASIVAQATNGSVTLNSDGSFTYTPNTDFSGADSFTYQASDGTATSNVATVTLNVNQVTNQPFAPVTPGSIEDPELLGTRMDTQPGAAPFTLDHTATAVDYTGFGNPPSYGPHHAVSRDSQGNSITPRPTGFYDTEQPDEDLVHNLEHGHVWISYNPSLISNEDHLALEQLVRDGGTDTGVILTPRSKNTSPIVVTSLTRQLTLNTFNATIIRDFVVTNRGHSPEGFIPSGQRTDSSETLDDGLSHSP